MMFAAAAFRKLLADYTFESVLDVGSGGGEHAAGFAAAGKEVTAVDLGRSRYYDAAADNYFGFRFIAGNFLDLPADRKYDVVWCSHVLEHQRNVGAFLDKCQDFLNPEGFLAVTVPPLKHEIVGGHLSLWNAGLLLYNLVLAGFDCGKAAVREEGYDVSVIVGNDRKVPDAVLASLHYDSGDVGKLKPYFPVPAFEGFQGRGITVNW